MLAVFILMKKERKKSDRRSSLLDLDFISVPRSSDTVGAILVTTDSSCMHLTVLCEKEPLWMN